MERAHEHPADRPLERRAAARTVVVWDALRPLLQAGGPDQVVIDAGGGTGGFAVGVAELGNQVIVVDPSPDALATLRRRAHERGVEDLVSGVQADLADLADVVQSSPEGRADVVLCHDVLGVLDDPAAALELLGETIQPGGYLSLLVGQRHAVVLTRAMAGNFSAAHEALDAGVLPSGERRFSVDEVVTLVENAGFTIETVQAVRVFSDRVSSSLFDGEPGALEDLVALERAVAGRLEYLTLASQVHLLARR